MLQQTRINPIDVPMPTSGTSILFFNLAGYLCIKDDTGAVKILTNGWGSLDGDIADQTDLIALLNDKFDIPTQTTDDITEGSSNLFLTVTNKDKLDNITVSTPVDLDTLSSRVNDLDAAVVLKGAWDASVGDLPGSGIAQAGWSYIVDTSGVVDGIEFNLNDRIVCLVDNASTSTYSGNWLKLDYTDAIASIDGQTGILKLGTLINSLASKVSLDAADVIAIGDSTTTFGSKKVTLGDLFNQIMNWIGSTFQPMLYSGSNIKTINGESLLGSSNISIPKMFMLKPPIGGIANNTVTRINVTNWSIPVTAGKTYRIEIVGDIVTALTSTGGSMGFIMSSGTASIIGAIEGDIVQTAVATGLKQPIRAISSDPNLAGSFFTTTGVGVANSNHSFIAILALNCITSGVFQVQWGSEIAGSNATLTNTSALFYTEF